jgi:hypothetical protein
MYLKNIKFRSFVSFAHSIPSVYRSLDLNLIILTQFHAIAYICLVCKHI